MATYIEPMIVAQEALIALENNLTLVPTFHQAFSKEYQSVGATVVIRKPATYAATTVSDTVNTVTHTESSVNVVLDKHIDQTVEITSQDLSLAVVDFSQQHIQPMMRGIAQLVDLYAAALYSDVAGHYAVSSTPAVSDIAGLEAVGDVLKWPFGDRYLQMHPITKSGYMSLNPFLNAEKTGDGGRALRKAELGQVLGFETYMNQNIKTHTTGGYGASTATIVLHAAGTVGGTALQIEGGVASGTINSGDVFKVTGYDQWHVVTTAATANANGTVTAGFAPALLAADVIAGTVTFQQTHRANMAYHKNAFAFVTAPLAPPIGGARAAVLSYKGLSCRVVYDYELRTKKNLLSIDMLCGFKTLDRDLAARLCDAR